MADFTISNKATGTRTKVILGPDGFPVSYVAQQVLPDQALAYGREMNDACARPNTQKHHRHIATIPANILQQLKDDGTWWDEKKKRKWLEDNKHFLVHPKTSLI